MNKSASILGVLCLFCVGAHAEWLKEGATAKDLQRDQSECERKARADTSFNSPPPGRGAGAFSGTRAANTMVKENQSFRLCMKSMGYAETPGK